MSFFKKISFSCLLLTCMALSANAQVDEHLDTLLGNWTIEARQFRGGETAMTFGGETSWVASHDDRYVHEHFSFSVGGRTLIGESFLGYSDSKNRYEYAQIDGFNPGMTWLTGEWGEDEKLTLESVEKEGRQMRWVFTFQSNDQFVVELFMRRSPDAEWQLGSDYTYRRVQ